MRKLICKMLCIFIVLTMLPVLVNAEEVDNSLPTELIGSYAYQEDESNGNLELGLANKIGNDYVVSGDTRIDFLTAWPDWDYFEFTLEEESRVTVTTLVDGVAGKFFGHLREKREDGGKFVYTEFEYLGVNRDGKHVYFLEHTLNPGTYYIGISNGTSKSTHYYTFHIKWKPVNAHIHSYNAETEVPATCTEGGYKVMTCECGDSYTENTEALGHQEVIVTGKAATCTEEGLTDGKKCSTCGSVTAKQETINAVGHEEEILPSKEPSCTEIGLTEGKKCTSCGTVTVKQETIPVRHKYSGETDSSCNSCGYIRETGEPSIPMFRMYDPNSGEHFYTGSEVERDFLVNAGWHYEGVGFNFLKEGAPVHRLYEPTYGEHIYTMDDAEVKRLERWGWSYEGVAFNSAPDTEVPQYRFRNPNSKRGAYHFTSSEDEKRDLIGAGWIYEGIGWYSCWE